MSGRFPGFDVLNQTKHWDHVTAGVVLERLAPLTQLAFFTATEAATARPLLDLLLGQHDDPVVPVLELIDTRLARGETDGWHYDEMPEDADVWRQTMAWLNADAEAAHHLPFARVGVDAQRELIQTVQDLAQDGKKWHDYPAGHVWSLWTRYGCTAFYSHPVAWNEIGFGGPAYPRGYLNLGTDRLEHWEVRDTGRDGDGPHGGDAGDAT
jgi:gluconate 2-dehydrogenase subunit 3-like protein